MAITQDAVIDTDRVVLARGWALFEISSPYLWLIANHLSSCVRYAITLRMG